jgi:hypothetical protein
MAYELLYLVLKFTTNLLLHMEFTFDQSKSGIGCYQLFFSNPHFIVSINFIPFT